MIGIDLAKGKDFTSKTVICIGGRSTGKNHAIANAIKAIQDCRVYMPKNDTKLLNEISKYIYAK